MDYAWIENGSLAVHVIIPDNLRRKYKDGSVPESELQSSGRVLYTWPEQVHCVHEYQDYCTTNKWSVIVIGRVGHVVPCRYNVLLDLINKLRSEKQGKELAS